MLWHGRTGLSWHRSAGTGGAASAGPLADRAAGTEPGRGGAVVGVQRQTVNIWLRRYREQGEDGVLDGRRVSPRRGKGLLTAAEAGQVSAGSRQNARPVTSCRSPCGPRARCAT